MKKIIIVLIVILFSISLIGCTYQEDTKIETPDQISRTQNRGNSDTETEKTVLTKLDRVRKIDNAVCCIEGEKAVVALRASCNLNTCLYGDVERAVKQSDMAIKEIYVSCSSQIFDELMQYKAGESDMSLDEIIKQIEK